MSLVIAVPYAGEEHQVGGRPQGTHVQLPFSQDPATLCGTARYRDGSWPA
jgi:hypothetical protein